MKIKDAYLMGLLVVGCRFGLPGNAGNTVAG